MIYLLRTKNVFTTKYYYDFLKHTFTIKYGNVCEVEKLNNIRKVHKSDIVIVGGIAFGIKAMLKGFKRIIIWFQGVAPEERKYTGSGFIKVSILSICEKILLKKSLLNIFVSNTQKEHYEKKYKIDFSNKHTFIMPCFNENTTVKIKEKRNEIIFGYVGGLAKWQCFNETVQLYKHISNRLKHPTKLIVLTHDPQNAKKRLIDLKMSDCECRFVEQKDLSKALLNVSYGFVIREDCIVNNVSSPTKFSTYVSNRITPIFSSCIKDFYNITLNMNCVIPVNNNLFSDQTISEIVKKIELIEKTNPIDLDFDIIMNRYYNTKNYFEKLIVVLDDIYE